MANVWDVYTVGDVSFIHEVFLGVSHIFYGTGHNVFLQVYMIGMLLGFIWIFIESMIQQKPIALGRFLVAFIIYSALFVPRATVHLEDSQTKKFYTMDNIPLGLAVGSSLVSKVGAGLTHVFEDYFTPVGGAGSGCSPTKTTCAGYLGSLSKIVQIRENLASKPAFLALDRAICGEDYKTPPLPSAPQVKCSIQKSVSNYVRHCGVNRFIQNPQLLKSVRNFNDFRYNNFSYNTDLYLWPDKPRTRNCYEAFIDIDTALTKHQSVIEDLSVKPQWLSGLSHDTTGGGDETAQMVTGAGVNHNQIAEILSQMTGASGTTPDVYTYIKNVMLRGPIEDGLIAGYFDVGDARAALMIKSARDQRNIQWAAEENMWISTAKAMATFFEGFVVALVVLIPFVMFMGGLNIMIEYLKVLMWVQLWNPVMAICNLYIQTVASQKVRDAIASSPITDMYVMDSVDEVVQHWIAVGGLMAATTPLLALFILKGSVYTFTTLASKMSGGDHVNEKAVSPDVMQHAPFLQNTMGAMQSDYGAGVFGVGSDSAYATITLTGSDTNSTEQAKQKVAQTQQNFTRAFENARTVQTGRTLNDQFAEQWQKNITASNVQGIQTVFNEAQQLANNWGLGGNKAAVRDIAYALSCGVGLDVAGEMALSKYAGTGNKNGAGLAGKLGVNGDASATWKNSISESDQTSWNKALQNTQNVMDSISNSNSLARAHADAQMKALQSVSGTGTGTSDASKVQEAYNQMIQSAEQYREASTSQDSVQKSVTLDSRQLARYVKDDKWKKWYGSLHESEKQALGHNNFNNAWGNKTGSYYDRDKTTALERLFGSERNSELGRKFRETFGAELEQALGMQISSGGLVNTGELKDRQPSDYGVNSKAAALESKIQILNAVMNGHYKQGDTLPDDVRAVLEESGLTVGSAPKEIQKKRDELEQEKKKIKENVANGPSQQHQGWWKPPIDNNDQGTPSAAPPAEPPAENKNPKAV